MQHRSVTDAMLIVLIAGFASDMASGVRLVRRSSFSSLANSSSHSPYTNWCRGGLWKLSPNPAFTYCCPVECARSGSRKCGGIDCDKSKAGVKCCNGNMWSKAPVCQTSTDTYCVMNMYECPLGFTSIRDGPVTKPFTCQRMSVSGQWGVGSNVPKESTVKIKYGFSSSNLERNAKETLKQLGSSVSAGFSFGGFGASASVSGSTAKSISESTSMELNTNADVTFEATFDNSQGHFYYLWEWTMYIENTEDVKVLSKFYVQGNSSPKCFPNMNDKADYSTCQNSGYLPGKAPILHGGTWISSDRMQAQQSTTRVPYYASKPLRRPIQIKWPGTCSHTLEGSNASYTVDLLDGMTSVTAVKLTPYENQQLTGIDIYLGDTRCVKSGSTPLPYGTGKEFLCKGYAEKITVRWTNPNFVNNLILCGFEVFGATLPLNGR